ncbi:MULTISPECIES: hypothetical protein [unclassified Psychrobacter]|uniref:hypothetical protein n=1 Tax=unclassified Psychrobacter TaxID=196806 RepID=UPI000354E686|nr:MULTISPECIES: hypothetical protein [unclassified Psychrobacter]AGP48657.1 hypothetical protein PSYCG_05660 [Psychrobacter sp. G]KAA0939716.1 LMBR1 domain-containing protein [Psychrobacter sp. ANT_H59]
MFDSDSGSKPAKVKLPKTVVMMVEKGNLVMAIKTLAADENISMDAAKSRIDAYELALKNQQQQKLNSIANKQGIPSQAMNFDRETVEDDTERLIKSKVKSTPTEQSFQSLQEGVDSQLNDLGYKKPLLPYWAKRLLIIAIIMAGLFWIMWRVFG